MAPTTLTPRVRNACLALGLIISVAAVAWSLFTMWRVMRDGLHPKPTRSMFVGLKGAFLNCSRSLPRSSASGMSTRTCLVWPQSSTGRSMHPQKRSRGTNLSPKAGVTRASEFGLVIYESDYHAVGFKQTPAGVQCYEASSARNVQRVLQESGPP